MWKKTVKDVTCKRCLVVLNKKIEHKEDGWTKANRDCAHRYPHLKHGVLCNESTTNPRSSVKFRAEVSMRKCLSKLCPIPHVPSAAEMVEYLVYMTIKEINNSLMSAERRCRMRFKLIAVHCKWAKPAIQDNGHAHRCTCPELKKWGKDPKFGWCCIMQNCPHMQEALMWRNKGE
jgi:hypothetical protein